MKPFVKMPGGKTKLLPALTAKLPMKIGTYIEPFVGGGALFFHLAKTGRFKKAFIGDANGELINAYICVWRSLPALLVQLSRHRYEELYYYRIRDEFNKKIGEASVAQAARFIYLNKTCFTPGSMVLTADERYVPIEDVTIGERLWGGRVVKEILKQRYNGRIYRVTADGTPFVLSVTEDHPVLMIPGKVAKNSGDRRTVNQLAVEMKLISASELVRGDYLLLPREGSTARAIAWAKVWDKIKTAPQAKKIDFRPCGWESDLARLFGYYAAEGCLSRRYSVDGKVSGIALTFNQSAKTFIRDAVRTLSRVFVGARVQIRKDTKVKRTTVSVASVMVGQFFEALLPGQSWSANPKKRGSKRLCDAWMTAPTNLQRELLIGWLRGDGHIRTRGNKAELVGTCSVVPFARQLYRLAQRCGLRPVWRTYRPRGKEMAVLTFANLSEVQSLGFALSLKSSRVATKRKFVGPYVAVRITDVTALEYDGRVHNLEVDKDHLLCVDGVVSHNCFNGLWRVNREGHFNVPFGSYTNPTICDEENLQAVSQLLQSIDITFFNGDFSLLKNIGKNDVCYCDPPYDVLTSTANFTDYAKGGFGWPDQERLAAWPYWTMTTNADTKRIRKLYQGHDIEVVKMARAINSAATKRGKVNELIIRRRT